MACMSILAWVPLQSLLNICFVFGGIPPGIPRVPTRFSLSGTLFDAASSAFPRDAFAGNAKPQGPNGSTNIVHSGLDPFSCPLEYLVSFGDLPGIPRAPPTGAN